MLGGGVAVDGDRRRPGRWCDDGDGVGGEGDGDGDGAGWGGADGGRGVPSFTTLSLLLNTCSRADVVRE